MSEAVAATVVETLWHLYRLSGRDHVLPIDEHNPNASYNDVNAAVSELLRDSPEPDVVAGVELDGTPAVIMIGGRQVKLLSLGEGNRGARLYHVGSLDGGSLEEAVAGARYSQVLRLSYSTLVSTAS